MTVAPDEMVRLWGQDSGRSAERLASWARSITALCSRNYRIDMALLSQSAHQT